MRSPLALVVAAAALCLPGTAAAKSWITFSAPPEGLRAGEGWHVTMTFPNHPDAGPLPIAPELVLTHLDTWEQRRFRAVPTARRHVFRARVELPSAGTWTAYVYDRAIGAVAPDRRWRHVVVRPAESDGFSTRPLLVPGVALCGLALVLGLRAERRRKGGDERAQGRRERRQLDEE
jgi:hypothetical protein